MSSAGVSSADGRALDELSALALALIGQGAELDRAAGVRQLRAITDRPVLLARAGGHLLGNFLRDPSANPKGLQAAALLDEAGAGREAQAVVVEALNVRARLSR